MQTALTRNQRLVLDRLRGAARPMTAYQLLDSLRGDGLSAPPTIYRALDRLVGERHVHRIESLNAYVACCAAGHHDERALAVCEKCGTVAELPAEPSLGPLRRAAEDAGFSATRTHIEITGLCATCRDPAP